jgi:hypothetical protein
MRIQHRDTNFEPDDNRLAAASSLQVFVAHHDLAAGRRAVDTLSHLGGDLGEDFEFLPAFWSFDRLFNPDSRDQAVDEALDADILILATSGATPLPNLVKGWAEEIIGRKRGTAVAVVALFDSDSAKHASASSRWQSVRQAAERAGLDFFAPATGQHLDATHLPHSHAPATNSGQEWSRATSLPAAKWGINE